MKRLFFFFIFIFYANISTAVSKTLIKNSCLANEVITLVNTDINARLNRVIIILHELNDQQDVQINEKIQELETRLFSIVNSDVFKEFVEQSVLKIKHEDLKNLKAFISEWMELESKIDAAKNAQQMISAAEEFVLKWKNTVWQEFLDYFLIEIIIKEKKFIKETEDLILESLKNKASPNKEIYLPLKSYFESYKSKFIIEQLLTLRDLCWMSLMLFIRYNF